MRIRTKLIINALLPLGLIFLVGSVFLYTRHQVDHKAVKERVTLEIWQKVVYLNSVFHDYVLHHDDRPRIQLRQIQTSLATLLTRITPSNPHEEVVLHRLRQNHESLKDILARLNTLWEHNTGRAAFSEELEIGLTGQALERTREMVDDVIRLHKLAERRASLSRERADTLVLSFTVLFSTLVFVISLMIMQRTSRALSTLQQGTRVIAEGNLDHTIPVTVGDELAQLSRAFNNMAMELKTSYAALKAEVAERTWAEEESKKYAAQLEISNRELQDFAFVASHDLQEPLRKIQAFSGQLKEYYSTSLDEEAQDYLDRMQKAATRMRGLIQALLTYSRIASKAQPFIKTDLTLLARDVIGDLETSIEEAGGIVEIGSLTTIEADPTQMHQLFQNLISNALKFHGEEKPIVRIHGETIEKPGKTKGGSYGGVYRILVEDNGIGFDEKYLDRIFTPFQRLHGRGTYEGTGIGLAICRKIVDRHRGSITATSAPGKGSTFIILLPMKQPREDQYESRDTQIDHYSHGR